jgi:penicillin amidase
MTRLLALTATIALIAACGGSKDGPFDSLHLDGEFEVGLESRVSVARDVYGVAHIRGRHLRDVAFVQGYVMAHDRLPQMDILRRYGAGTLAELFGALDPSVIDTDLEMRMHRMRPLAQESFDQLKASADAVDGDVVGMLERFSDGVNAYAADLVAAKWDLDPNILVSFDPERFAPWSPIDSLVLGRFQAFALSYTAPFEIEMTELYQKLRAAYPTGARASVASDILTFKPVGLEATIPDFPDNGTAADGSGPMDGGVLGGGARTTTPGMPPAPAALAGPAARPIIPDDVLAAARTAFARTIHTGPMGALGPHAFMHPYAGSNNWAVTPDRTVGDEALLATDQHLQLTNPSIFYPTHVSVDDGDDDFRAREEMDVLGVTFPGIPGVILGSNGNVAWSGTVSEHDVNDVYLETLAPCPDGACVKFNGAPVKMETFTEEIRVGALGTITNTFTATYERVPHHGPVLPEIDRAAHRLVPRPAARAPMSVRYTGYEPTFEIRALLRLGRARSGLDGFKAMSDFTFGSQNWTMIDNTDWPQIGWTTNAYVPLRSAATYRWNAQTRPDDAAPFFVLSGEGGFEWEGRMPAAYIPHARSPWLVKAMPPQYQLVTANADPVGATFDNDPLNQRVVDGRPLYVGVAYAAGVRQERITKGITSIPDRITPEQMEALQHDTTSTVGAKMMPGLMAALANVTSPVPAGAPLDVKQYLQGIAAADRDRLITARTMLAGWSFATPAAADASGASAATAILNAWMHFFIEGALADELGAVGFDVWRLDDNQLFRIVYELLRPDSILSRGTTTGQPILCDGVAGGAEDSCTKLVLISMLAAMKHLESPEAFGTPNTAEWAWGRLHHLTIQPLFPNKALNLPAAGEAQAGGFPKAGDNFNVNRADMGWRSLSFSQHADGPAQRFIAVAPHNKPIRVRWQIPGGAIFDSRSPHYRDLLDQYYLPEKHFDAPYQVDEIVGNGEGRWEFE